jgi:ABC-type branched-subunit amino acid transport system substrate-binding protein
MGHVKGGRILGLGVVLAVMSAGCGTRLGDDQAAREARADARRAGLLRAVNQSSTAAGDATSAVATDSVDATTAGAADTASGATSGATTGGGAATSSGDATASGGATTAAPADSATAAPAGGNGGATDIGLSATELKVGWVGTLSGPVPGLFRGALVGTQAAMAYQNSLGGVFGRKLKVQVADDAFDSGRNRAGHLQLKDSVFSFVGSFSVNDDGGISVLQDCKCPDIGAALTRAHAALPTSYSPQPIRPGWRKGLYNEIKAKYGKPVIEKVAFFVSSIQSARQIAADQRKVMESLGYKIVYTREIGPNETNFTSDVIQMRNQGVKMLAYQGDVGNMARLAGAMHQQNFKVDVPNWGNAMYDDNAFKIAGKEALEGTVIDAVYGMFRGEDGQRIPEIALFNQWMKKVDPNQVVDLFSFYGWLSGRLFVEAAQKAGAQLTRQKILTTLSQIGTWDGNGAIGPVNVGQKRPSDCFMVLNIRNGKFVRTEPTDKAFKCDPGGYAYL